MEKLIVKPFKLFLLLFILFIFPLTGFPASNDAGNLAYSNEGIILYTPYTSRSITPGETLSYEIEVINRSDRIETVTLKVLGISDSWEPNLTAGNTTIQQISVKPESLGSESSKTINFGLTIPLEINQGTYDFEVLAETKDRRQYLLPLQVRVTEQGVFETELEVNQANMEGYADDEFNYSMNLANRTGTTQNYSLTANAPPGWDVRFRVRGSYVTSVNLESGGSENININVRTPSRVAADTYQIGIRTASGTTSNEATLETVIKGQYDLDVTTPSGRLSANITAGSETEIPLQVRNTGSVPLRNITLSASPPEGWSVEFDVEEDEIPRLEAGESRTVTATVQASGRAIAGDYRLTMRANTSEASANATFRITVQRSIASGTLGILLIILVIGGISFLFRKYGRR
ncbi:MAG: NEW3 domain-containing protein [Candidatus Paceibacterota bacterium]